MRRELAWVVLLGLVPGCGGRADHGGAPPVADRPVTPPAPRAAHHWKVFDRDLAILEVSDEPGPVTSTALPPPGARPVLHPFLSAHALDASHEDQLRRLLDGAHDLDGFLRALGDAGFRVVADVR